MKIEVTCCRECPFFANTLGTMIAAGLHGKLAGECDCPTASGPQHNVMGATGPAAEQVRQRKLRRLRVVDGDLMPERCPLRVDAVSVAVKLVN